MKAKKSLTGLTDKSRRNWLKKGKKKLSSVCFGWHESFYLLHQKRILIIQKNIILYKYTKICWPIEYKIVFWHVRDNFILFSFLGRLCRKCQFLSVLNTSPKKKKNLSIATVCGQCYISLTFSMHYIWQFFTSVISRFKHNHHHRLSDLLSNIL